MHLQEWYHIKNLRTTSLDVSESYLISSYRSLILPARQFLGKQETGSAPKNKTQTTCACITITNPVKAHLSMKIIVYCINLLQGIAAIETVYRKTNLACELVTLE